MPEPITKPTWPWADRLREDIATLKRGDDIELMHNPFELQRLLSDHLAALEALNVAKAELARLNDFCWHIDTACDCPNPPDPEQAYHAMRAARDFERARTAAAEAAVQRVREIESTDRGFVRADDPETTRWMQGWDECLAAVTAALNSGSAGQPAPTAAGKDGHDAPPHLAEPYLPADPADSRPVTITGRVHRVEVRENRAGAQYLELTLGDPDAYDPDLTTVTIPPAVYAQMDAPLKPYAGTQLRISGCTRHEVRVLAADVRQPVWHLDGGEPVYDLSDQPLPAHFEDGAR